MGINIVNNKNKPCCETFFPKTSAMYKTLALLIFCLSAVHLHAQIRAGQLAPGIHIGEWVSNPPADPNPDGKFIVLEFWTTWCAPCIKAVPHLNALQAQFADRKDLYFISISDEEPDKIRRTLQKVDMRSMVAADDARKTFKGFGVSGIPHTVLIDSKGMVQWVNHPERLNATVLQDFLAGQLKAEASSASDVLPETVSLGDAPEPVVLYRFEVTQEMETLSKGRSNTIGVTPQGARLIFENHPLSRVFAILMKVPEHQIRLPDSIAERAYNIAYIDPAYRISYDKDKVEEALAIIQAARNNLLSRLLDVFGLQQSEETEREEVYVLRVHDASKFEVSDAMVSHMSSANGVALFGAVKVENMAQVIGNLMNIHLVDETGLSEKYDFHISTETIEDMINSLLEYGLEVKREQREVKYLRFVPKG
jgi:uncharacterized protein (TIGR03435 family)